MTTFDEQAVATAVERSADPERARTLLERLVDAHPKLASDLATDPFLADAVVAVCVASRSLFALLERDPVAVQMLRTDPPAHPLVLADDDPPRALRRWKHRELARIAALDLTRRIDMREVGTQLADLAQACLAAAHEIVAPPVPIAIIGMGKLGGRELNYASDVDVLFVHRGDDVTAAEHAARDLLRVMGAPTAEGIVFRTDAALRPEGRAGALSRTLDAYAVYWERWAQAWELQALIKARAVAGDADLGAAFSTRAAPFVWPEALDPDAIREIRAMKARTEGLLRSQGLEQREVKRGYGGIRDVEFSVQLLQLVHGRSDSTLRAAGTLEAIEQLARGGYISTADAARLDETYSWLRTVEHRLQLVDEQQTHTIPTDDAARTHLARVLGFRDGPSKTAVELFDEQHRSEQLTVRALHEKLFFAPLLDALAGAPGALPVDAAEARLAAFGFHDVAQTRAALNELAAGLTRRSRVMQQLLPVILTWLSASPDPDLGLLQLRRLSEGYTRSSTLARRFRETPIAAERACRVLGSSRVLGLALHRHPDVVDALADDAFVTNESPLDELRESALATLDWRDDAGRRAGLRRFKRRETLRIGTRDVVAGAPLDSIGRELAHLADACIDAALQSLEPTLPFAVVGLGRLGGCELSYASDIDIFFVYDGSTPAAFDTAERLATTLVRAIGETTSEGATFRVDTRLRPEGGQGPLARSLEGFRTYYERWAQTWEFQSLIRARVVGGDAELGARFLEMVSPFVYRDPMPAEWRREVRRMKARIERERIPPGEDPQFHLKLGPGALTDVEFTVQLAQLEHGHVHPEAREASTLGALGALTRLGLFDEADADLLRASYILCERARNARYLLRGTPGDALPVDADEATKLARCLGYVHRPQQSLREDYRRTTRRARAVIERCFYGRTAGS